MEQPETAPLYTETAPDGRKLPFWEDDTLVCYQYTGYNILIDEVRGQKAHIIAMCRDLQKLTAGLRPSDKRRVIGITGVGQWVRPRNV